MEEKSRYEEMYGKLVAYEQNIHLQNQKRIKIGLKCIAIIPPIFLILLFGKLPVKVQLGTFRRIPQSELP